MLRDTWHAVANMVYHKREFLTYWYVSICMHNDFGKLKFKLLSENNQNHMLFCILRAP